VSGVSLKRETRSIDGLDFAVTQHGARRSLRLDARIMRQLGPGLADVLTGERVDGGDLAAMARGLVPLFAHLTDDDADALVSEILAFTSVVVDGCNLEMSKAAHFEQAFAGRRMTLWKVVGFALEVNYRDFFDAARAAIERLKVAGGDAASPTAPST
jgi:hypothetical protein